MAKEAGSPEQAVSEIEAALRSMETLASKPAPAAKVKSGTTRPPAESGRPRRSIIKFMVRWLLALAALCVLPLLTLVRLSVWIYSAYGVWPWVSILGGVAGSAVVLTIVVLVLIRAATGSFRSPKYLKRALVALVVVYCGYSAMFISAGNVKTEAVRATYTSLNPSLRLALSTWMLADPELVITDGERKDEDYDSMGLPPNEASLHKVTSSGYVHAVDLRTIGRPEWRNFLTTIYFKSMGFQALRHTGTADHLHVSLPVHE